MKKTICYTDGSANWKTGEGGSACVFVESPTPRVLRKGWLNTKTGRSEIHAAIIALENTPKTNHLLIFSDSKYVVDTIIYNWYRKWIRCDENKKNMDLWIKVKTLIDQFNKSGGKVELRHVKGHSGNIYNELADQYADYKTFKIRKKDLYL